MTKKRSIKRELIEWGGILAVFAFLYFTGLYKDVAGALQGLILKTGIIRPDTEVSIEETEAADYNFSVVDANGKVINVSDWKGKVIFGHRKVGILSMGMLKIRRFAVKRSRKISVF